MDHSCLLASPVFLSPLCNLCSLGALSELNTVIADEKGFSFFHISLVFFKKKKKKTLYLLVSSSSSALDRYAYSEETSEEFDKDDTSLTLIKPSPIPSKDVRSAGEGRPVEGSNGVSNGDLEEDKTE
jgi:hypothetical protein